ncbi:ribonuclease Y [Candidatus Uhrbacteria bacterium]|nr:ribonuclease Y [Candidatus Uhrbacteria bacterium]
MSNTILIGLIAGGSIGAVAGYLIRQALANKKIGSAEERAEKIQNEAKTKAQEMMLQAKEKSLRMIEEVKRDEAARRKEISELQKRIEKRESLFDQKLLDLQSQQQKLQEKVTQVETVKSEIQKIREDELKKLEMVAGLPKEDAKAKLFELIEAASKEELMTRVRKLDAETSDELERRAKKILSTAVQRIASSHSAETTTTAVELPSDEMKGRIIGKEGRNIKTIEQLTGTEIIVDDTPNVITVSGFSPVRRQIAKRALDKLIADGRIHPGRIEESIEEAKRELALDLRKSGEDALYALGIHGVDPKLTSILGRLKYRTSYGQNVLLHSMEVANIAAKIAEELGADVANCKKGGLFHDIGKAVDHDIQGSHPEIGYNLMLKFGFPEDVAYHCIGHHEDKPKTVEAIIVKAADAISGARPGARKDTLEQYAHRLGELEGLATSFPGVLKAYAIQAGRELRVFVSPKEIDDFAAYKLASDIARRVENELKYPGEIRVAVIRETRVIEYAR